MLPISVVQFPAIYALNPTLQTMNSSPILVHPPTSIGIARQTAAKGEEPQQRGAEGASFGGQGGRVTGLISVGRLETYGKSLGHNCPKL